MAAPARAAYVSRKTKETQIEAILNIDGGEIELPDSAKLNGERKNEHAYQASTSQYIDIDTGIGFLDHMLHALSKHAGWSLFLRTKGDLHSTLCSVRNIICRRVAYFLRRGRL